MSKRNRQLRPQTEQGGTLVLVAVFTVALCAFAALSVDVGNVLVQRSRLQEAGDSAAMASVKDWAEGALMPVVTQRAKDFDAVNGVSTNDSISVRVGKWDASTRTFTAKDPLGFSDVPAVEVTNQRIVPMAFAKVIGMSAMSPRTISVAVVAQATSARDALPWAACSNSLNSVPLKCEPIVLKNGNDCASSGNFGALALGGTGGAGYKDNIVDGYQGVLHVGDLVDAEPGNKVGPTTQGLNERLGGLPAYVCTPTSLPPDNKRLAIIPVTTDFCGGGRSCQVMILGFWTVALIDSPGNGGVVAQFLGVFNGTEVDPSKPPIIGMLNGVRLVR